MKNKRKSTVAIIAVFYAVWLTLVGGLIAFESITENSYKDELAILNAIDKSGFTVSQLNDYLSSYDDEKVAVVDKLANGDEAAAQSVVAKDVFSLVKYAVESVDASKTAALLYNFANDADLSNVRKLDLIKKYDVTDKDCEVKKLLSLPLLKAITKGETKSGFLASFRNNLKNGVTEKEIADVFNYGKEIFSAIDTSIEPEKQDNACKLFDYLSDKISDEDFGLYQIVMSAATVRDVIQICFAQPIPVYNLLRIGNAAIIAGGNTKLGDVLSCASLKTVVFLSDIVGLINDEMLFNLLADFDYYRTYDKIVKVAIDVSKLALPLYTAYADTTKAEINTFAVKACSAFLTTNNITSAQLFDLATALSAYNARKMSSADVTAATALLTTLFGSPD